MYGPTFSPLLTAMPGTSLKRRSRCVKVVTRSQSLCNANDDTSPKASNPLSYNVLAGLSASKWPKAKPMWVHSSGRVKAGGKLPSGGVVTASGNFDPDSADFARGSVEFVYTIISREASCRTSSCEDLWATLTMESGAVYLYERNVWNWHYFKPGLHFCWKCWPIEQKSLQIYHFTETSGVWAVGENWQLKN